MVRVESRLPVLLVLIAMVVVGCSGGGGEPRADEETAPSDNVMQNGLPIHWVESMSTSREYYEGLLYRGELDHETRGLLVVTKEGPAPPWSYELTESKFKDYGRPIGGYAGKFLGATKSAGSATTADHGGGYGGYRLVYRLDGGGSPTNERVFLWTPLSLLVTEPSPQPGRLVWAKSAAALGLAATASKGRVEIRDMLDRYLYWGIRLRVGEELVARLQLYNVGCAWELKPETAGTVLRQQGARADEHGQTDYDQKTDYHVFTLRAVESGVTELVFDYRLADGQLSTSYATRVVVH